MWLYSNVGQTVGTLRPVLLEVVWGTACRDNEIVADIGTTISCICVYLKQEAWTLFIFTQGRNPLLFLLSYDNAPRHKSAGHGFQQLSNTNRISNCFHSLHNCFYSSFRLIIYLHCTSGISRADFTSSARVEHDMWHKEPQHSATMGEMSAPPATLNE